MSRTSTLRPAFRRGVPCLRWRVWAAREPEVASGRTGTFGDLTQEGRGFTKGQDERHWPLPGPGPLACPLQDPEGHQRQLKKKQKNQASAQRSRKKHTEKADALHQVGILPTPTCPAPLPHPPVSRPRAAVSKHRRHSWELRSQKQPTLPRAHGDMGEPGRQMNGS